METREPEDLPRAIVRTLRSGVDVTRRDIVKRLKRRQLDDETPASFAEHIQAALDALVERQILKATPIGGGGKGRPSVSYKLIGMYSGATVVPPDQPWIQTTEGSVVVAEQVGDAVRFTDRATLKTYTFSRIELVSLLAEIDPAKVEMAFDDARMRRAARVEKRMEEIRKLDKKTRREGVPPLTTVQLKVRASMEIAEEERLA